MAVAKPPARDTQMLSSVSNAARVLKAFGQGEGELGVSELARRLDLSKSATHRLVRTLTAEELLEQDPRTGAYRLSITMQSLGCSWFSGV